MVDLNSLLPVGTDLYLFTASFVDDEGRIAAFGALANGDAHAVLLIPCDEGHPNVEGCDYSMVEVSDSASAQPRASTRVPPAALWRQKTRFHFFRLPKN